MVLARGGSSDRLLYSLKSLEKKLEKIPLNRRVYLDESGINKYLHREYARSLKGKKVIGEMSGKRFAKQSVISALFGGEFLSPMWF